MKKDPKLLFSVSYLKFIVWKNDKYSFLEPPVINCADEYMEAVIDKNMLRAKNWDGGADNIFLAGPGGLDLADADPSCFSGLYKRARPI